MHIIKLRTAYFRVVHASVSRRIILNCRANYYQYKWDRQSLQHSLQHTSKLQVHIISFPHPLYLPCRRTVGLSWFYLGAKQSKDSSIKWLISLIHAFSAWAGGTTNRRIAPESCTKIIDTDDKPLIHQILHVIPTTRSEPMRWHPEFGHRIKQ